MSEVEDLKDRRFTWEGASFHVIERIGSVRRDTWEVEIVVDGGFRSKGIQKTPMKGEKIRERMAEGNAVLVISEMVLRRTRPRHLKHTSRPSTAPIRGLR